MRSPSAARSAGDGDRYRVERTIEGDALAAGQRVLRLELAVPLALRLDRLLATELGVPRARIAGWHASGALRLEPEPRTGLRARVRGGQRVLLAGPAAGDAAGPLC